MPKKRALISSPERSFQSGSGSEPSPPTPNSHASNGGASKADPWDINQGGPTPSSKPSTATGPRESVVQRQIQEALASSGRVTLWRNSVGFDRERKVRYGLAVGSADLIGFIHGTGQFLGVEIKTEIGRLSKEQTYWINVVNKRGGRALVLRSVDEAEDFLRGLP